jgi:hypothetical protein
MEDAAPDQDEGVRCIEVKNHRLSIVQALDQRIAEKPGSEKFSSPDYS